MPIMKLSHYLKIFSASILSEDDLLFSTSTGALALVAPEEVQRLQQGDFTSSLVEELVELGLLVHDAAAEQQQMLGYIDELNNCDPNLKLDIIVGMDCNFACPYCYEEGVKAKEAMSSTTIVALLTFAKKQLQDSTETIHATFYGGEPLLYPSHIKEIATGLQQLATETGVEFGFTLITNGSLLRPALVQELIPLGLEAAKVTLDGLPENHNLSRPFRSGQPSFALLIENIRACAHLIKMSVGGNFSQDNYHHFPGLIDLLQEQGLDHETMDRILFYPIMQPSNEFSPAGYRAGCASLAEDWLFPVQIDLRQRLLAAGYMQPELEPGPCKVMLQNSYTIHYNGDLYKCPVLVGRHDYVVGDIWQGVQDDSSYHLDHWRQDKTCQHCEYLPLCFGGCRAMALQRDGHMAKVDCQRTAFDATLESFVWQDVRFRYGIG